MFMLENRFALIESGRRLGRGMGVVYKAEDTVLRRFVALKFPCTTAASDASLRARFFREAQAVYR